MWNGGKKQKNKSHQFTIGAYFVLLLDVWNGDGVTRNDNVMRLLQVKLEMLTVRGFIVELRKASRRPSSRHHIHCISPTLSFIYDHYSFLLLCVF